jgi:hypothetical protein
MQNIQEPAKIVGDFAAGGITVASLLGYLPAIAAFVSIVYGCLRIYEWFEKRRKK